MRARTLIGLALGAVVFAACGGNENPSIESNASPEPSENEEASYITVADQSSDGTSITIAEVEIKEAEGGFIAIHTDQSGAPGPVVGHSAYLKPGENRNVAVKLDSKQPTADYWPMLHIDSNKNQTYDFPTGGADPPIKAGNDVVMKKIHLTVM
jgi:hypothetical protein